MSTKVRLWRWRRNPLKRGSDVAEAWTVLAAGVLLAAGAPAAGAATAIGVEDATLRASQNLHTTSAVLAQDAPAKATVYGDSDSGRVRAAVRWAASGGTSRPEAGGGTAHTGKALVKPGTDAGARATIWLDEHGALKDPPATPAEARGQGIFFGSLAAAGTGVLVLGGRWARTGAAGPPPGGGLGERVGRGGPEVGTPHGVAGLSVSGPAVLIAPPGR